MLDSIALTESTLSGGFIVLLVLAVLRFEHDIVDVLASLDDSSDLVEEQEPPGQ